MKTRLFILAALAMLVFASCSEVSYVGDEEHEIMMSAFTNVNTKAPVTGTSMPTGRSIALSAYYADGLGTGHSQNYFTDANFVYSGSGTIWSGSPKKYWPHQGTMDFVAISRTGTGTISHGGSNVASSVTYTMSDNSSSQDDVMMARATGVTCAGRSSSNGAVSLTFKHCQAQIVAKVSCAVSDATNNYGVKVRSMTLKGCSYAGKVTYDGSTMSWSNVGTTANVAFGSSTTSLIPTPSTGASPYGTGILVPAQTPTGSNFYVDIEYTLCNGTGDNHDLSCRAYIPALSGGWTPGNCYIYTFNFTMNEITVSASVTDWNGVSGGTVTI